ncbi:MAG TPA: type II toxin-antitoxin system RelE/ParE family toxin [Rhizomicrobium sp.]|nr:type II toxin-antitoxin system RelE/ParE family toxin [Rhizomicrobium sp.]
MMVIKVVEYIREDGSNPFKEWFDDLDAQAAAKVATATLRLEMGNTSNVKWIGAIGEYRINWGPGYRLYLGKDGEALIILLVGGTKKRQQTDIERAKNLLAEYKARKAAGVRPRSKGKR